MITQACRQQAVSLTAEVSKQGTTENSVAQNFRSVTISISEMFIKSNI